MIWQGKAGGREVDRKKILDTNQPNLTYSFVLLGHRLAKSRQNYCKLSFFLSALGFAH